MVILNLKQKIKNASQQIYSYSFQARCLLHIIADLIVDVENKKKNQKSPNENHISYSLSEILMKFFTIEKFLINHIVEILGHVVTLKYLMEQEKDPKTTSNKVPKRTPSRPNFDEDLDIWETSPCTC